MPRINPEVLRDILEGVLTTLSVAEDLSRNIELSEHLEAIRRRLEAVLQSIEALS
jgi:hypothetical protein